MCHSPKFAKLIPSINIVSRCLARNGAVHPRYSNVGYFFCFPIRLRATLTRVRMLFANAINGRVFRFILVCALMRSLFFSLHAFLQRILSKLLFLFLSCCLKCSGFFTRRLRLDLRCDARCLAIFLILDSAAFSILDLRLQVSQCLRLTRSRPGSSHSTKHRGHVNDCIPQFYTQTQIVQALTDSSFSDALRG